MRHSWFLWVALVGCDGGAGGGDGDPYVQVVEVSVNPNRDLDLLFVIDDSPSMFDKQKNLADNFPRFIDRLNATSGGFPNLHVGVVTSDMGTKGSADPIPGPSIGAGPGGCAGTGKGGALQITGAPVTGSYLSDVTNFDGGRDRNYTGDISTAFATMAKVGAAGCGFEQHLAAMRASLDGSVAANAGFLRDSAVLAVIFVADEDDCSFKVPTILDPTNAALGPLQSFRCTRFGVRCETGGATPDAMNQIGVKGQCGANPTSPYFDDVAPFHDFLLGLKGGDTSRVIVAGIVGASPVEIEPRTPPGGGPDVPALKHSCMYTGANGPEVADPPARLEAFLDLFPERSTSSTICQQDLSGTLDQIGQLVIGAIGNVCVTSAVADTDPELPGVQYDCKVEEVVGEAVTPIPPCDGASTPTCWSLDADPANCTMADHLKFVVHRGTATPDPTTVVRMKCIPVDAVD
jgi:hypothetical protein